MPSSPDLQFIMTEHGSPHHMHVNALSQLHLQMHDTDEGLECIIPQLHVLIGTVIQKHVNHAKIQVLRRPAVKGLQAVLPARA